MCYRRITTSDDLRQWIVEHLGENGTDGEGSIEEDVIEQLVDIIEEDAPEYGKYWNFLKEFPLIETLLYLKGEKCEQCGKPCLASLDTLSLCDDCAIVREDGAKS